jgi:hypothetical protein
VCERWVYDAYFQHFTGEEFFQHEFPHERSDRGCPAFLLNIEKRSLPRLMLSGDGLASNDAV